MTTREAELEDALTHCAKAIGCFLSDAEDEPPPTSAVRLYRALDVARKVLGS